MPAEKVANPGGTRAVARPLRRAWQWWHTLPSAVTLIAWILLAIVFGRLNFVLFAAPVVIGLWLSDTIRPVAQRRLGHRMVPYSASMAASTDLSRWVRHLAQMIVAMYAGMTVYHLLIGLGIRGLGEGDLGYAGMILSMLVPMVALMRFQRHSWRMASEMSIGMTAPMVVCLALVRLGICPLIPFLTWLSEANVYAVAHDAMLLGMMAVMVYRRGMYAAAPAAARQDDRVCAAAPEPKWLRTAVRREASILATARARRGGTPRRRRHGAREEVVGPEQDMTRALAAPQRSAQANDTRVS